jgi:hypothetical protein
MNKCQVASFLARTPVSGNTRFRPWQTFKASNEASMIFAEMEYLDEYWDFHEELKEFLCNHFSHVESGIQLDSWFWILDDEEKVALDTFSSTKHQVKSAKAGAHVEDVIRVLRLKYAVRIYPEPELEGHEET